MSIMKTLNGYSVYDESAHNKIENVKDIIVGKELDYVIRNVDFEKGIISTSNGAATYPSNSAGWRTKEYYDILGYGSVTLINNSYVKDGQIVNISNNPLQEGEIPESGFNVFVRFFADKDPATLIKSVSRTRITSNNADTHVGKPTTSSIPAEAKYMKISIQATGATVLQNTDEQYVPEALDIDLTFAPASVESVYTIGNNDVLNNKITPGVYYATKSAAPQFCPVAYVPFELHVEKRTNDGLLTQYIVCGVEDSDADHSIYFRKQIDDTLDETTHFPSNWSKWYKIESVAVE